MRWLSACFLTAILVGNVAAGSASPEKSILVNGGFEKLESGWSPWFKDYEASWCIDKVERKSGKCSVRLNSEDEGRHFLVCKVPVSSGTTYKVSFWVKTDGNTKGQSAVSFDFRPKNAKPRSYKGLPKMRGSKPWTTCAFYAEAPTGATAAYLCLIATSGTIWFDDITVVEEK